MEEKPIKNPLPGKLRQDYSLTRYTGWRVGGRAKQGYHPCGLIDLQHFLAGLPNDEPLLWLGLGSNLLVRDGGFSGTVIHTLKGLANMCFLESGLLRAESGVTCAKLAKQCVKTGCEQGVFWGGIPGTVGGALAMNAGAYGHETWDLVAWVETIDRDGRIRKREKSDFGIGYREVQCPEGEWFVSACFDLGQSGDTDRARKAWREVLQHRADTQPIGTFNCGSVFRNPPGDYAARLIEACGLKGKCIGGAEVSKKHANFIVSGDQATALDIECMIQHIQMTIDNRYGIYLLPEVHRVGVS